MVKASLSCSILMLAFSLGAKDLTSNSVETPVPHGPADSVWMEFQSKVVELQRKDNTTSGNHIVPIEYTSARLRQNLPGCRAFMAVGAPCACTGPYIADPQGQIHAMEWSFKGPDKDNYYTDDTVSDFFTSQSIRLRNEKEVVGFARLLDELNGRAGTLAAQIYNTQNYTLYDPDFYTSAREFEMNWECLVRRQSESWIAWLKYVGPRASIMVQGAWVFEIDKSGQLKHIRQCDYNHSPDAVPTLPKPRAK